MALVWLTGHEGTSFPHRCPGLTCAIRAYLKGKHARHIQGATASHGRRRARRDVSDGEDKTLRASMTLGSLRDFAATPTKKLQTHAKAKKG